MLISALPPFSVHLFFLEPFTFFLHIFLHILTSHLYNTIFIYSQFFPHLGFPFNITLITLFKSRSLHILPSPLSLSLSFSFYSLPFLLQWVISQSLSSFHLHQGLLITPFILLFPHSILPSFISSNSSCSTVQSSSILSYSFYFIVLHQSFILLSSYSLSYSFLFLLLHLRQGAPLKSVILIFSYFSTSQVRLITNLSSFRASS